MSDVLAPVGFRFGTVFELNASGYPAATSPTVAYEGLQFYGPKAYTINIPETRKIAHAGKDRVIVNDQLPSLEVTAGEIRVSTLDYDLDALLQNVIKFTKGMATMLARNTDQQGFEPNVGMLLYQQSKDVITGLRNWHFHIIPSTQAIPIPASFTENPEDHRYSLAPTPTTKHLWGELLTTGVEGTLESGIFDGKMDYKPKLVAWKANGSQETFDLPADAALNTYVVYVNGVLNTSVIKTTAQIDFDGYPPANNAIVVAFYGEAA